jgi:hypothetical protein
LGALPEPGDLFSCLDWHFDLPTPIKLAQKLQIAILYAAFQTENVNMPGESLSDQ